MRCLVVFVLLLCSACSSVSPVQSVQPEFYTRSPWLVEGRFSPITRQVKILIDGEPALTGSMGWWDNSVVIVENYSGAKISAYCSDYVQEAGNRLLQCSVDVDGKPTTLLVFE